MKRVSSVLSHFTFFFCYFSDGEASIVFALYDVRDYFESKEYSCFLHIFLFHSYDVYPLFDPMFLYARAFCISVLCWLFSTRPKIFEF